VMVAAAYRLGSITSRRAGGSGEPVHGMAVAHDQVRFGYSICSRGF
jgi:hypothetical protein